MEIILRKDSIQEVRCNQLDNRAAKAAQERLLTSKGRPVQICKTCLECQAVPRAELASMSGSDPNCLTKGIKFAILE